MNTTGREGLKGFKKIKSGKFTKSNINNRGYNKYLKLEGEVAVNIDYDKLKKRHCLGRVKRIHYQYKIDQ